MNKYYIAYGSNMDLEQMANRCPDSKVIGTSVVHGYELLFKGSLTGAYATIEQNASTQVPILVWEISKKDEECLDRYEGYPNFYYKKTLKVDIEGQSIEAMVYIMHEERKLGKPSKWYFDVLKNAYTKFHFDMKVLNTALDKSSSKEVLEDW